MKLSIHPTKNKPINYGGLGYDWQNIECDWSEAFELITVDGRASSAELKNDHRCDADFVSRQLFMADIDDSMTFDEIQADPLYKECGAGIYATPSYPQKGNRFRICFITENPITVTLDARHLFVGLLEWYQHADPSCKDATRLFFGCENSPLKEIGDNILTQENVDALIANGKQLAYIPTRIVNPNVVYQPLQDKEKERIIKQLCMHSYTYDDKCTIAWGMKSGGFSEGDFRRVMQSVNHSLSNDVLTRIWSNGNGNTGIGSVKHLLKLKTQANLPDVVREAEKKVRTLEERIKQLRGYNDGKRQQQ